MATGDKERYLELLVKHPGLSILKGGYLRGDVSTGDVIKELDIGRTQTSDLLKELEKGGLVSSERGDRGKLFWKFTPQGKLLMKHIEKAKAVFEDPVETYKDGVSKALELLHDERKAEKKAGLILLKHLSRKAYMAIIGNGEVWDFFTEVLDDPSPFHKMNGFLYYFRDILFPSDIFGELIVDPFPDKETEEKVIGKLKEYCLQPPPNDHWMIFALEIMERYNKKLYDRIKKEMGHLCLNPPDRSWINPALETIALEDFDQFVTVIEQVVKNLPDEYWNIEPIKNAASRYTGNKRMNLINRIKKIRTDTTDKRTWERADNLFSAIDSSTF
ncbi:hypothetical protein AKJ57_05340 [candidate division MSBL1 archaeon SCGC-AAA259A05]|uniref:Uncharacterized protein n=1 Tax=candidate division MSBL1 archaeon SCGC-AAA259A05 TaxID=1698259 RepID=A0A133U5D6_9EURY|nr:hypothetical protein AKJ57_05340 [candidate division MSBL1 archaeon SCGC-AAA259A05]